MNLVSPVYFKELAQIAFSRRSVILKAVFLFILMVALLILFANSRHMDSAEFGRGMFITLSIVELLAVVVFTPVITAGMVSGEREANTLGLLFLTRLKSVNIVQDKGLSRITYLVYICLLSLPFMFGAMLFGGVEFGQILVVAANVLSTILFCGGLGLLCSTLLKKYSSALACMYTMILVYYLLLPIALEAIFRAGDAIVWINPFASVSMVLNPRSLRLSPWVMNTWISNLAIGLSVYAFAVTLAAGLLRRTAFEGAAAASTPKRFSLRKKISGFFTAIHPARLLHRRNAVTGNPMAWKESNLVHDHLRVVIFRLMHFLYLLYVLTCIGMLLTSNRGLRGAEFHVVMYALGYGILAIFTIILCAGAFSKEREAGTFNLLLTTRLRGRQIVLGTFSGLAKSVGYLAFFVGIIALVGAIGDPRELRFWFVPLNFVVFLGNLIILCMFVSMKMRSTAKSVAIVLGIVLVVTVLPPLLGAISRDNDVMKFFLGITPELWICGSYLEYDDIMEEFGGFGVYIFVLLIYAFVGYLMLMSMINQFDQYVGRQKAETDGLPPTFNS